MKKIIAFILCLTMCFTMLCGFTQGEDNDNPCLVELQVAKNFEVSVPKKITLDGNTKKADYTVNVKGDIGGLDTVTVTPENSFNLTQGGKEDVEASVTQDKTEWNCEEVALVVEDALVGTTTNGEVSASDLTAGTWQGKFNFVVEEKSNTVKVGTEADWELLNQLVNLEETNGIYYIKNAKTNVDMVDSLTIYGSYNIGGEVKQVRLLDEGTYFNGICVKNLSFDESFDTSNVT